MFIQIDNRRIKTSSIQEYEAKGLSSITNKFILATKISGKERLFSFDNEKSYCDTLDYLDSVLKVTVI